MVPVLTYHSISRVKDGFAYTITEEEFAEHVQFLRDEHYRVVSIVDYYKSLLDVNHRLPGKSVLITFDDGHRSAYDVALPILKDYSCTATFFVTTDWIGKPEYMNKEQLKTMELEGMSVESHCKTHSFLNKLEPDQVFYELSDSKATLDSMLAKPVRFVSFPGGRYNKMVMECARKAGYDALFSSAPFDLKKLDSSVFLIGRSMVKSNLGLKRLDRLVSVKTGIVTWEKSAYFAKFALKKLLPAGIYKKIWDIYSSRGSVHK